MQEKLNCDTISYKSYVKGIESMKVKIYGQNIQPACEYCEIGRLSPNKENVLCPLKGVVLTTFSCRKFKYDPLKRKPKAKLILQDYSEEDFSL